MQELHLRQIVSQPPSSNTEQKSSDVPSSHAIVYSHHAAHQLPGTIEKVTDSLQYRRISSLAEWTTDLSGDSEDMSQCAVEWLYDDSGRRPVGQTVISDLRQRRSPPCSSRVATNPDMTPDGPRPPSKIFRGGTPGAHRGTRSAQDLQARGRRFTASH